MTIERIKEFVSENWLEENWDEFIDFSGRITRTLVISTAVEKQWSKPMKTVEDFKVFYLDEAEAKNLTPEEVEFFFFEAGRLKARNYIFDKRCVPLLPQTDKGKCEIHGKVILEFINKTVGRELLLKR